MKKIIMLIGPSASGKSTIEKLLFKKKGFNKAVSCTTRKPRKGEINGVDYFFLSKEEFLNKTSLIEQVEFAGNYYGVSDEQIPEGKTTVLVVEPKGAKQILEYYKNDHNTKVFVVYFDISKWTMLKRMLNRGDGYWNVIKRVFRDNIAKNFKKLALKPDLIIKRDNKKSAEEIADYIIDFFKNR